MPDQKVYWLVRSKLKSNVCMRPVAPASFSASTTPTSSGSPSTSTTTAAIRPATISTICFTSVQVTACTPPNIV